MIRKKIAALLAVLLAATPSTVLAWGPERTTYANESPAPSATFNSITNNAAVGDEREFVRIREKDSGNNYTANTDDSGFLVEPGKTYEVYIYYHNDAASNTNETGVGVATGVKMNSHFTYKVTPDESGYVQAKITAADTTPLAVWDELKLIANEEVNLNYIANSATIHNSWKTNEMILVAENFFSDDGVYLGVNSLNGVVFGCAEYSGYVTYEIASDSKDDPTPTPDPDPDPDPDPTPDPDPDSEKNCKTNPEMEGCSELPDTGPVEIILAIIIVLGIGGGGYYLYRTRRKLKKTEKNVMGEKNAMETTKTDESIDGSELKSTDGGSQNPDNMVK